VKYDKFGKKESESQQCKIKAKTIKMKKMKKTEYSFEK